jgi:hypothetical protein
LSHIKPDLGNKSPGSNPLYSGHCGPTSDRIGEFLMLLSEVLQAKVNRLDLSFEEAKLAKQAIEQEAMMVADAAFQCQLQLRDLAAQLAQSEVG